MDVVDTKKLKGIITKAQKGDKKAIRDFVDLYQEEVSKFAYYLTHNREEALDLAQQSFLKALENLNQIGEVEKVKSWLMTICRNLFLDSKKKKREELVDESSYLDNAASFESKVEVSMTVNRVLGSLDPDDRLILILVDRDGLAYKEVAEILRQSESNVKTLVYRARQKFVEKWSEVETFDEPQSSTRAKRS